MKIRIFSSVVNVLIICITVNGEPNQTPTLLKWEPCGDLQCATLQVPMNYSDPSSPKIEIALNKYEANTKNKKSALLTNPGGPGASGLDFVQQYGKLLVNLFENRFDIIGFDPRGVGKSAAINCIAPGQSTDFYDGLTIFGLQSLPDNPSHAQMKQYDGVLKLLAYSCEKNAGKLLKHLSTANVARDMELIRQALGMEEMNFLGMSYGGYLGAIYANMYPNMVGRMIFDSFPQLQSFSTNPFK